MFFYRFLPCASLGWFRSIDDVLYYIPSKDKKEKKQEKKVTSSAPTEEIVVKSNAPTTVYTSPGNTTVVVQDRKGNTRDVDEYNRRYDSRENDFVMEDDTLYIKEKAVPDPDGEWVNGFDGSEDDYEYAMRIVRFRNPRYAVSISSPYYWDIVYGLNSWDWNVYTDGMYAYAFPTFSNRLWWLGWILTLLQLRWLVLWLGRFLRWLELGMGTSSPSLLSWRWLVSRWRWTLGRQPLGES